MLNLGKHEGYRGANLLVYIALETDKRFNLQRHIRLLFLSIVTPCSRRGALMSCHTHGAFCRFGSVVLEFLVRNI